MTPVRSSRPIISSIRFSVIVAIVSVPKSGTASSAEPEAKCEGSIRLLLNRFSLLQSVVNHLQRQHPNHTPEHHAQHLHLRPRQHPCPYQRSCQHSQHHRHCQPRINIPAPQINSRASRRGHPNHEIRCRGRHLERQLHSPIHGQHFH